MTDWFNRFASKTAAQVARAWFFSVCLALVISWMIEGICTAIINRNWHVFLNDKYQLQINTTTTIITFLLVALLQNTQDRTTRALHYKHDLALEAIAQILDQTDDVDESGQLAVELRRIIGVEESSRNNTKEHPA